MFYLERFREGRTWGSRTPESGSDSFDVDVCLVGTSGDVTVSVGTWREETVGELVRRTLTKSGTVQVRVLEVTVGDGYSPRV